MEPLVAEVTPPKKPTEKRLLVVQQAIRDQEKKLGAVLIRVFKRKPAAAKDRWKLEGTTGPHSSMQFPGDRMEADHQPHFKLLEHVQALKRFQGGAATGSLLFAGMNLRKGGLYGRAFTIVLGKPRHKLGRTHSGKSHDAFTEAMVEVDKYQTKTDDDAQRKAVIAGLTWSMKKDAAAMRA